MKNDQRSDLEELNLDELELVIGGTNGGGGEPADQKLETAALKGN